METGQVSAAVSVRDGVCVTEDLIIVAVVVLDHDIHEHILGLFAMTWDSHSVDDCFIGTQLPDELLNSIAVKLFGPVFHHDHHQRDFHARIQERQFPQAGGQQVELKLLSDGEDLGSV